MDTPKIKLTLFEAEHSDKIVPMYGVDDAERSEGSTVQGKFHCTKCGAGSYFLIHWQPNNWLKYRCPYCDTISANFDDFEGFVDDEYYEEYLDTLETEVNISDLNISLNEQEYQLLRRLLEQGYYLAKDEENKVHEQRIITALEHKLIQASIENYKGEV